MQKQIAVVRVRNPDVVRSPVVLEELRRAFEHAPAPLSEDGLDEMERSVERDTFGLWLVLQDGLVVGSLIATLPGWAICPVPQIFLIHNTGLAAARNALIDEAVDFFKGAGYSTFWAIVKDGDSAAVRRAFRRGGTPRVFGHMMEFTP